MDSVFASIDQSPAAHIFADASPGSDNGVQSKHALSSPSSLLATARSR